jgi:hypothetical protein
MSDSCARARESVNKMLCDKAMIKKLVDYIFPCIPVSFKSAYTLEESIDHLRKSTNRTIFTTLFKQSAVGRVDEAKVRLQRVIPLFGNSFKPIFVGNFVVNNSGVFLEGNWTTFLFSKIFSYIWFSFVTICTILTTVTIAPTIIKSPIDSMFRFESYFPLIGVGFFVSGIFFNRFCWWFSRRDIDYLTRVISTALSKETLNQEDAPDQKTVW